MEQRQQGAFLTAIQYNKRHQISEQSKLLVIELKQNIKSVLSQLPQRNILMNLMNNLGRDYNIITNAQNICKKKDSSLSEMKTVYKQIKFIEKQISKIRSTYKKTTFLIKNSKSENHSKQKDTGKLMQKSTLKSSNISEKFSQCDQLHLKNQIQRELQYRKYVQNTKDETYVERKRRLLAERAKKASQRNKKCQMVLKKVTQKQRDKQLTFFNKFKAMTHEDFSIWAKHTNRHLKTSQNERLIIQGNQSSGTDVEEILQNDKIITDRSNRVQSAIKKRVSKRNSSLILKRQISNESSLSNFQIRQARSKNAKQKRNLLNLQKEKQAISTVIRKNLTIQSIHHKRSHRSQEDEKIQGVNKQVQTIKDKKKIVNQKIHHSQHHSSSIKNEKFILQLLDQKSKNKQEILKMRSQNIRSVMLKNRQRFFEKRNKMEKQNQTKFEHSYQNQVKIRKQRKQVNVKNQMKFQQVIRKKRQMFEHKQKFSDHISNLRYVPSQILQKNLAQCEEQIKKTLKFKEKTQKYF